MRKYFTLGHKFYCESLFKVNWKYNHSFLHITYKLFLNLILMCSWKKLNHSISEKAMDAHTYTIIFVRHAKSCFWSIAKSREFSKHECDSLIIHEILWKLVYFFFCRYAKIILCVMCYHKLNIWCASWWYWNY